MCTSAPKAPAPLPARQAPRMADPTQVRATSDDRARRRVGLAATIMTGPAGLAPAQTTGKTLLGA